MARAERLALVRALAETAATAGIPLGDTTSPGQLARRHDQNMKARAHVAAMDNVLTAMLGTPNARVMIFSPPQVGKSSMTRWFAFWWLTMHPKHRLVLASYAASLAVTHGSAVRDMVRMYGDRYGLIPHPTEFTKAAWRLRTGGGLRSVGVGGGLAGQSMDLGLIDDPVKDRAEAESAVYRNSVWDWYSSVFSSRRQPGTRELLVMTRYHQDDLAGRLLDRDGRVEDGGEWVVLHMPAIALAEDHERGIYQDPLGRAPGEPISHPLIDADDTDALLDHWKVQRARSTDRDWNSLYLGVPWSAEGALLTDDDVRAATAAAPASFDRVAVGVDPSGDGRDSAGVVVAGLAGGTVWFLDDKTARMSTIEWPRRVCLAAHEHDATTIVVETNYGGGMATTLITQAWEQLAAEGAVSGLCPYVQSVSARKSKALRAEPIAQAIKTGRARFAAGGNLRQIMTEWKMWEPGSSWSPGALDAGVHVAVALLPEARGTDLLNPASRTREAGRVGGIAGRRLA